MKSYLSRNLLETMPTYLLVILVGCIRKVRLLKNWLNSGRIKEAVRTYDIVNCGPRTRFVVGNLIAKNSLGFGYGLGPTKYRADMEALGYSMSEDEAREVHTAYWNLYKGVKDYERELKRQHTKNRGWILNGIGRPLGIHQDYTHDIINRTSQSTGHDLLVYWVYIYSKMLADAGIEWHPIIVDFHDESIIEVEEGKAEQALTILIKAFEELNRLMNCSIPLTGEGIVCDNLAEVKIED